MHPGAGFPLGTGRVNWQRLSPCPRPHAVGGFVVGKFFFFGIPAQLSPQLHGNVAEVAHAAAAMANFGGEVGVAAALDTVKEIAVLACRAGVNVEFVGPDHAVENLR